MIEFKIIRENAADEAKEFERIINGATPASIYDDVTDLQADMQEVFTKIGALETAITGCLSTTAIDLNNRDLNECIGKIIFGYGNHCTNKPTGHNGFLINIPHNSAPDMYGKQIWITRPSNNVFVRNLENGVFGDWAIVRYVTDWQTLTLASGVNQQNATQYPCRFRRDNNRVYIEGCVTGFAEVEKVICTLPENYRPKYSYYFQTPTNAGKTDTWRVYTDGRIQRIATTYTGLSTSDYHFITTDFSLD